MIVHDDWLLTPVRAALHLPTATAVIADLHLGYEQARHRCGEAVPGRPIGEILSPLNPLLKTHDVKRLVIAGDLFEGGPDRGIAEELRTWLDRRAIELAVVPGNHDGALSSISDRVPVLLHGCEVGGWHVVHGDGTLPSVPVVQGHEHPWFRFSTLYLSAPCYLVGPSRLILPAFSTDASGVNVLPGQYWRNHRCCVIAGDKVLDFGELGTLRKRLRKQ
jgi:putative SbcD/Mre11-related phosphoesterase